jgi:hypothetical protein
MSSKYSSMRRKYGCCAAALSFVLLPATFGVQTAQAADDLVMIPVADAMGTAEFKDELDGSVSFYFGNTAHPEVVQTYGNFVTNKKTNAFAKDDGTACRHVLLSALISLQDRAKSLGGNAVVNIMSYFKKQEASHDAEVECYVGFIMAGVALKGDVVKVGGN